MKQHPCQNKVRKMRLALSGFVLACGLSSCAQKVLFVPERTPVMVKAATEIEVYAPNAEGVFVPAKIVAQPGWWLLSDDAETTGAN